MKIYKAIPWSDLVKSLKIWSNKKGPDRIFTPQGMLAIRTSITTIKCKKTYKDTDKRTRSLLYVLKKILALIREIENNYQEQLDLPEGYYTRIKIIRKVLKQQKKISETGVSVPDRIVSISKSYIRPIVRGKEVIPVEFGAKVNMIQFDGINFIEYLSFNAFNEGTRLVKSIRYRRSLFGKDHTYIG